MKVHCGVFLLSGTVANSIRVLNRRGGRLAKLNGNAARDKRHQAALKELGWRVIVVWECESESPQP
jgi:G:T-mismatch repair DNA endonuclease (very short patch repair protein)